jgi:acetyl-CoA synthetase
MRNTLWKICHYLPFLRSSFAFYRAIFKGFYPNWQKESVAAWVPTEKEISTMNITDCMKEANQPDYKAFHTWSHACPEDFWKIMIKRLHIVVDTSFEKVADFTQGVEHPQWLKGTTMNIVESCFHEKPACPAIIYRNRKGVDLSLSYEALQQEVARVACSLRHQHIQSGDAIAIIMPMTIEAIVSYLSIIYAGGIVVSIPDSCAIEEIKKRIAIANVKMVITQDKIVWRHTAYALYEKIVAAQAPQTIVISAEKDAVPLRAGDIRWEDFLKEEFSFSAKMAYPEEYTNILFSSGTTGEPKGIPWTHTTPIKCAADAYLHHNIKSGDVLAWPTNLGWMMGPWLIYAALLNKATIAVYEGAPTERGFGEFMQAANVTMLGLVPSIVKSWRTSRCMEGLSWPHLKVFSSSGEPSRQEDMLYLMFLAGYKPIIEYCGGTEIGGAYITNTMTAPIALARFNTPALGLDFVILNEKGKLSQEGEVAIVPPSIGLSTTLINKDHHEVYFKDMPHSPEGKLLRRHGDELLQDEHHFYTILGRADDTMKLNGIKVSAIEIENALTHLPHVLETVAISVAPPTGGPSELIIYAVMKEKIAHNKEKLKKEMQAAISQHLNPFFKIHEVILIDQLPRTHSNKIQRRKLREKYKNKPA